MHKIWSAMEREFIRKNAGVIKDVEGARQLSAICGRNVTVHAWRKQRQKLGAKKSPGRGICKLAGEVVLPILPIDGDATESVVMEPALKYIDNAPPDGNEVPAWEGDGGQVIPTGPIIDCEANAHTSDF